MSYETHNTITETAERSESLGKGGRLVPLAAAIIAVLAALATLFAQHRSISALSVKNDSILAQARSLDLYNYYQARRTRFTIYTALLDGKAATDPEGRARLQRAAQTQQHASVQTLARAKHFEATAAREELRSESILQSFETLEIATTMFEISIVFVSIAALSATRILLYFAGGVSVTGVVFLIVGLLQTH